MKISEGQQGVQDHIQSLQNEYRDGYSDLNWISPETADTFGERRQRVFAQLAALGASFGASDSKVDMRNLSPGCRICVEGGWSCLFINGRCNCRCFYCPAPQDDVGEPITNTISFPVKEDYAAYIQSLGFTGVSISGGEPFLTFDRSLSYIRIIKENFGESVHTWLYTNGSRVTREKLLLLKEAGLNEIRFDIGATGYRLKKAAMAAGIIPNVTIEIPAIPEEQERLKFLLPQMTEAGVSFLNLHQLRLTPHNFSHLSNRGYTFLHGKKALVMESELTALEILRYGLETGQGPGVNYCSFAYKNRYQQAASRRKAAVIIQKPYESVSPGGYIRTITLKGSEAQIKALCSALDKRSDIPKDCWQTESGKNAVSLRPELISMPEAKELRVSVAYSEAILLPSISYFNPFKEIRLSTGRKIYAERQKRLPLTELPPVLDKNNVTEFLCSWKLAEAYELIEEGFSEFF